MKYCEDCIHFRHDQRLDLGNICVRPIVKSGENMVNRSPERVPLNQLARSQRTGQTFYEQLIGYAAQPFGYCGPHAKYFVPSYGQTANPGNTFPFNPQPTGAAPPHAP